MHESEHTHTRTDMHMDGQTDRQTSAETGNPDRGAASVLPTSSSIPTYPSDFFFMAGTISVSMSTFRSNFKVKHSLLGS